jgi:hypothetical protein
MMTISNGQRVQQRPQRPRKGTMKEPLPERRCVICDTPFMPWRKKHVYCSEPCRRLVLSPTRLAEHLKRVYGMLADKGVVSEEIRALVSRS